MMAVFEPGNHGSTFGGNPLACAVATAAIDVLVDENLAERAAELGDYFRDELRKMHPHVKLVRGKGLLIGVVLHETARPYSLELKKGCWPRRPTGPSASPRRWSSPRRSWQARPRRSPR